MRQTLNHFFESGQPLIIATKVTNGHKLTGDLINHVYLIMYGRDIDDLGAFFARCSYQQWNWRYSEFSRLYRMEFIELNEDITPHIEQEYSETKYQKFLRDYLEAEPNDLIEWYTKNIAKLVLQGVTYRQLQKDAKINKDYITQAIKKFKHDVLNNFEQSRNRNDSDDSASA